MACVWDQVLPEIQDHIRSTTEGCHLSTPVYNNIIQEHHERTKERKRERLARALEAGFSSVEEHRIALSKENAEQELRWMKRMEEESGIPFVEWWANHPQREETPVELFPHCDCDGM